ncbi:O-fucosyltransferase family protein isoform 2 [Hibiscus syriacus]|uniref:O-fucosyltransferase family protein n=1 Tax=Hibiscus syriacus TaxID=106335 RepID=A0A6A3B1F7_HIBSY|nr:O-fucosyltransferase 13-like [Hibiscus syriacus]KAE8709175.1 O-fucosyltransferase family protein isoform 2 [Hibiscus syriacus]
MRVKPLFIIISTLSLFLAIVLLSPSRPIVPSNSSSSAKSEIWNFKRIVEWRPCNWWLQSQLTPLPSKSNGYIRVDCYGGLNQIRRDFCDGVGIARVLNATLVLPKFEVAAYWNESSGFTDVFDVDYFINKMNGFVKVVKELPPEISSKEPYRVDCSKRKGQFDYIESVLPSLLKYHYISITPAMSQRRDRYPKYAKAAHCQACYSALRLTESLEKKANELLEAIPKPFLSLHLRFEPDMVAYSQCQYSGLSSTSMKAIQAARGDDRKPWTGEAARIWRNRGKCPLTPNETAFILQALSIPTSTNIYLAAGDGLMEIEGLTSIYTNVITKSALLSSEDFGTMHGNTKAALDYFVSINSDSYMATYFGNMDKMVAAMRAFKGLYKTLFLSRRAFANLTSQGLEGKPLMEALWKAHKDDFIMGRGSALSDCFCEFKL